MPAPTQVPPFLAAVLGGQSLDDAPLLAAQNTSHGSSVAVVAASDARIDAIPLDTDQAKAASSMSTLSAPPLLPSLPASASVEDAWSAANAAVASPLPTLLVPPLNFDMVCASRSSHGGTIYRSGFPNERNYPFLNTLNLRTVVYLSSDNVRPNLQRWIDSSRGRTRLLHFRLSVNKEPFAEMDEGVVRQALESIMDRTNSPMLLHCNKGKYRVGVVTALIRRMQGWSMTSIYDEYARFAGDDRIADEEFIDMFPLANCARPDHRHAPDWLSTVR